MKRTIFRQIASGILILCMILSIGIQILAAESTPEAVSQNGKIEANLYLLYSNRLPENVNKPFEAVEFGPSGNNTAYITVTVDLNKVQEKAQVWVNESGYQYYSIDSDQWVEEEEQRIAAMKSYWETVIYPAIDQEDRQAMDLIFGGAGNFYGYVLKKENYNVWHIDGILAQEPPVYVVELYDYTSGSAVPRFNIAGNQTATGVSYPDFKREAERVLGGSNYQYTVEKTDEMQISYQKDGKSYQAVITPKNDEGNSSRNYHVYPSEGRFGYREITPGIYYLCRMKLVTKEIGQSLSLKKLVTGSGANPMEHFGFRLSLKDKNNRAINGTYPVSYTGIENCQEPHPGQLTFSGGAAEISLKNGEAAVLSGLPQGSTMLLTEEAGDSRISVKIDGTAAAYPQSGLSISIGSKPKNVEITNHLDAVPVTGRTISFLPALMGMGITAVSAAVFLSGCRKYQRTELL